ncbi:hypothetical protein X726_32720 [Mesorhizobium sp. L103C105A0]|nr:hypothetical protein X726_32720 [Mesorhizobium sp. L103C105A0]
MITDKLRSYGAARRQVMPDARMDHSSESALDVTVYVASAPVDFRKGPFSLMTLVRDGGVDSFDGLQWLVP